MKQMNQTQLYKLSSICFAFASVAFLIAGLLSGNQITFFVVAALFVVNSSLFFILSKKMHLQK